MKIALVLTFVLALFVAGAATAAAQSPSPSSSPTAAPSQTPTASPSAPASASPATPAPVATATPPATTVPQFSFVTPVSSGLAGPDEDSWYVYASGFTPRTDWIIGEVLCPGLPCSNLGSAVNDNVKEDGTMTFYVRLPRATDPSQPRTLAAIRYSTTGPLPEPVGATVPADAPTIQVAGHNPGTGLGYPSGTRTGIAAVDQVIALVEAHDTAAIRARLVLKSSTNASGEPVRGVASWQCAPYVQPEDNLVQIFEYPAGPLYAVFRVPVDPALPLRYRGAAYGLAYSDGGVGTPLGGLILVSDSGQIVGTEIRCGTTPGFHVHNFTDFLLAPFVGPAPATATPRPPGTGSGRDTSVSPTFASSWILFIGLFLLVSATAAATIAVRRPRA